MRNIIILLIVFSGLGLGIFYSSRVKTPVYQAISPGGVSSVQFFVDSYGRIGYAATYKGDTVVRKSALGLSFKSQRPFLSDFEVIESRVMGYDDTWKPVWGERSSIKNSYTQLIVKLKEKVRKGRYLNIHFRAYDDGVAFRYEIPWQAKMTDFVITDELTEFQLTDNHFAWWIPANYVSDEMLYNSTHLSEIDSIIKNNKIKGANELYMENAAAGKIAFNTPLTMRSKKGVYMAFHEAELIDNADMTLALTENKGKFALKADLVPYKDGTKAIGSTPYKTPWRTLQLASSAAELAQSDLIVNLNEPNEIKDADIWCKPIKYIGVWWGYHIGKWSWDYPGSEEKPHGATTENAKAYIDFAAQNGIEGVLVEGWNTYLDSASAQKFPKNYPHGLRDYTKAFPDYDLYEVARYAKEKGIQLIVHNETMGAVKNYEQQLEKAFQLYQSLDIHYVKTGYAWYIENKEHFHHDQWMQKHYAKVMQLAAKYKINIIAHESNKDSGLRRRFPNMMSREALRGNEYNAWDKAHGNPPEHETIIPFTRALAGPIDFTPGIFDINFDKYKDTQRVNTTKAKQLALYVVLYSPVVMAADLIENYASDSAFKFVKDVPATWDESKVLDAEIGNYVITARRKGKNWFVGALTDENARQIHINFDFLPNNKIYVAEIYADSDKTNLASNPTELKIYKIVVDKNTSLPFNLAESGGLAIRLVQEEN